jgi:hypothetical protein
LKEVYFTRAMEREYTRISEEGTPKESKEELSGNNDNSSFCVAIVLILVPGIKLPN